MTFGGGGVFCLSWKEPVMFMIYFKLMLFGGELQRNEWTGETYGRQLYASSCLVGVGYPYSGLPQRHTIRVLAFVNQVKYSHSRALSFPLPDHQISQRVNNISVFELWEITWYHAHSLSLGWERYRGWGKGERAVYLPDCSENKHKPQP